MTVFFFLLPEKAAGFSSAARRSFPGASRRGTPQFAQVDLAREALKDYHYDWAKARSDDRRGELCHAPAV